MKIYNKSVLGAGHVDSGLPCQDYSISQSFEKGSIAIISDGHGSKTYVRSQVGSKLASEIALEETKRFVLTHYDLLKDMGASPITYTPDSGNVQDPLFAVLFNTVHDEWYNAIVRDFHDHPFSNEEQIKLGNAEIKKAYGCTLLVAVKTPDFTFIYQLGDGRIFTITPYSRKWEQPVPWDSLCVDNITTSLCNANPVGRFRYCLNSSKTQPFAIFLCSDGIEDCYDGEHDAKFYSEELEVAYTEILSQFLQNDDFDEKCAEFLSNASASVSKDDMSIAFIIDDICGIQDKWIQLNRLYRGAFVLKSEYDKCMRRIDQNKERLSTVERNIGNLNSAISAITPDINAKTQERSRLQQEKVDLESRPAVCESFLELIGNLLDTIKVWCEQDRGGHTSAVRDSFNERIREMLELAIKGIKTKLVDMQSQIPGKVSKLQGEIEKLDEALVKLEKRNEQYEADRSRHLKTKSDIEAENQKLDSLKEEKIAEFQSYKRSNLSSLQQISEEIKKAMGVATVHAASDVKESETAAEAKKKPENVSEVQSESDNETVVQGKSGNAAEALTTPGKVQVKDVGRFWNIAKSPEEEIRITVYNNNVLFELTDFNGRNSYLVSLESFRKLQIMIDNLYRENVCSFEVSNVFVTIITDDEKGGLGTIELPEESADALWSMCMELIQKQR